MSREHRIDVGLSGIVSVLGGKLTSFRALADEVVRRAAEHIGRVVEPSATATLPLDGGDMSDPAGFSASATAELSGRYRVPRAQAERLVRTYGTRVTRVAALLDEAPHLLARLCPHHPHTALEAVYAAREEMAVRLSDFFFRRTRVAYGRCRGLDCADATAEAMALELGWSFARQADEAASFRQESEHLTVPRPD